MSRRYKVGDKVTVLPRNHDTSSLYPTYNKEMAQNANTTESIIKVGGDSRGTWYKISGNNFMWNVSWLEPFEEKKHTNFPYIVGGLLLLGGLYKWKK